MATSKAKMTPKAMALLVRADKLIKKALQERGADEIAFHCCADGSATFELFYNEKQESGRVGDLEVSA